MILARANSRLAASGGAPAQVRSATPANSVEVLSVESPHAEYFVTRAYDLRHPTFDGGTGEAVRREVFVAMDAAIVLPYDPGRDRVLMVEQFRMGPFGRGDPRPWTLEPVAGRVDPGETPEAAARRECLEETGVALDRLEPIARYYCSPGCSTEFFHNFVGICALPETAKGQGGLANEHEDIRTHVLEFDAAMELVASGEANVGPLVMALIWLSRERARLRAAA
jgi:nudix-type nucleoside diphosphatase (YffH/AdpP family)